MKVKLSVTRLLDHIYPLPKSETVKILMMHGKLAHEKLCEVYESKDYDCDVRIELDRGFYILTGIIDIVDHEKELILEAKPRATFRDWMKSKRARLQLSAYTAMWRKAVYGTVENGYYGAWLVYNFVAPWKYYIVKPMYLDMTILNMLDSIAKEVIRMMKNDAHRPSKNSRMDMEKTRR